jgi:hypothetical protein
MTAAQQAACTRPRTTARTTDAQCSAIAVPAPTARLTLVLLVCGVVVGTAVVVLDGGDWAAVMCWCVRVVLAAGGVASGLIGVCGREARKCVTELW